MFRPSGGDFQGIGVYRSDVVLGRARKHSPRAPIIVFDEPTRLSLSMVASLQGPLPFHLAQAIVAQVGLLALDVEVSSWLLIHRVFAVLAFEKFAVLPLLSPDLLPCPLGVFRKVRVSLGEVEADGLLGGLD